MKLKPVQFVVAGPHQDFLAQAVVFTQLVVFKFL
jgi:hypothetical protein